MVGLDWWALPRCPRCFRAWICWTVRRGHVPRMMNRPHAERVQLAKAST